MPAGNMHTKAFTKIGKIKYDVGYRYKNVCKTENSCLGSFACYVRKIFRINDISYPLIPTRTCAYDGVRKLVFRNILRTY